MKKVLRAYFLGVLSIPVVIVLVELGEQGKNLTGWPGVFVASRKARRKAEQKAL
jgi:hypothetical protein